ncbi:unnamed protein product [Absidia cylindrospora]
MDLENYCISYHGDDECRLFFKEIPLKDWSYPSFERWFASKRNPQSQKAILSAFKRNLTQIQDSGDTPPYVKNQIGRIFKELNTSTALPPTTHNTYNLSEGSSTINYVQNSNNTVFNQHSSSQPLQQQVEFEEEEQQQQEQLPPTPPHHHHHQPSLFQRQKRVNEEGMHHILTDDDQTKATSGASIVEIMTSYLDANNFSRFHRYRLESHGIIQTGKNIHRQPDVPSAFYDQFINEVKPPTFPHHKVTDYLKSTLLSDLYGTRGLGVHIFSMNHINEDVLTKSEMDYIMRAIYILSENIHCRRPVSRLSDSEVSYCYYALWPLIDLACGTVHGMSCNFKVGETPLTAMKSLSSTMPGYSADGTVFLNDSGLEILLFEASGAHGTRDRSRHAYDHIKGAYGCYSMLNAILRKYPHADRNIMDDLRVLFLHSSGKDDHIRLWVMKPCYSGTVLTFERIERATITTNFNDTQEAIGLIKFFWLVKGMLERSREAVQKLKHSNDMNHLMLEDTSELDHPELPSLLKPRPIKPAKGNKDCNGIADLDPISILF